MAQDVFKPKGSTQSSKPDAGGGQNKNVPVFGIVKDNVDPTRSGRIKVYIADSPQAAAEADNSDNWVTVSYMTNFFGKVIPDAGEEGFGDYKNNPSSYGEWHAPPDIGTTVVCIFINGDPNYGFYIGCVPDADSLYMVPAIGASDNIIANGGEAESYGGALRLPVTNINTNNKDLADSPEFVTSPRPVHSYSASIMNQQGIIRDPIRGPISSSAQRESRSRVGWGVSTPGRPIYEGGYDDESIASNLDPEKAESLRVVARRGGHSIVMDDGDIIGRDQLIRIRTALGHQILMSDDGQTLMILHSNGQSYIELGKEGTVDIYSTNSINMRTQGDLNLHADQNINIHAMENINVQAKNFHVNTEEELRLRAVKDIKAFALNNFTVKATSAVALASGGDASMAAGGDAYINGAKVNLNSGSSSTQPQEVDIIPIVAQTDTLYDEQKGFLAAPGKLLTIATRAPAHAPWANAGQGVDVKTKLDASSQLPAQPAAAVEATNNAAANTSPVPVSVATAASAPPASPVSQAMDQGTTNAVLGTVATSAATGPAAAAVQQGAAVVTNAAGKVDAAVGAFAQTPAQLATSGVIKPGADKLVTSLVQTGANVAAAMPDALFSGKAGAQNLGQLVQNTTAQASSLVSNLQTAQKVLTAVGAVTGKEAPAQIAGLVTAAATIGTGSTVQAIQQVSGKTAANASNLVQNVTGAAADALKVIGAGAAAAQVASINTGPLGGIAGAVKAMSQPGGLTGLIDAAKGVAGSAFNAIKNSFKPLEAGVPQNLSAIAKSAAQEVDNVANTIGDATDAFSDIGNVAGNVSGSVSGVISGISDTVSDVASTVANAATKVANAAGGLVDGLTGGVVSDAAKIAGGISNVAGTVNAVSSNLSGGNLGALASAATVVKKGAAAASAAAIASGVSNLPGGVKTVAAVVNNAADAINAIPGAASVKGLINEAQTAAMNGLPLPSIPSGLNSLASLASAGLPAGAAAQLNSAIAALSSGTAGAIKLPTVGFNTTDRTSITSQIVSVLGDPKIPTPNLIGEISEGAKSAVEQVLADSKEIFDVVEELEEWGDRIETARNEFYEAESTLPQGDPKIDEAREKWFALLDDPEYTKLGEKLADLKGTAVDLIEDAGTAVAAASDLLDGSGSSIESLIDDVASLPVDPGGESLSVAGLINSATDITSSITRTAESVISNSTIATTFESSINVASKTVTNATSLINLQSNVSSNLQAINNSIAGIVGDSGIPGG